MPLTEKQKNTISNELDYKATKSSGPGGQSVNKVNTSVELRFNIDESNVLDEKQKNLLFKKLQNRINTSGELVLTSQVARSQWQNKINVTNLFFELVEKALKPAKKRIKTKPSAASIKKRLNKKKQQSEKKELRKPPNV